MVLIKVAGMTTMGNSVFGAGFKRKTTLGVTTMGERICRVLEAGWDEEGGKGNVIGDTMRTLGRRKEGEENLN